MTDEQYVRSVWERRMRLIEPVPGHWVITSFDEIYNGTVDSWPKTPAQNWAAAAEFTRSRMEDIRQLREEVSRTSSHRQQVLWTLTYAIVDGSEQSAFIFAQWACRDARTLSRLESELARLTKGIKPEVLEKK